MKLLLYLCIVSCVFAKFNIEKCTPQISNLIGLLSLKPARLKTICASDELVKKETDKLREIVSECGLDNWQKDSQDPKERRIGSVVEGIFGYLKNILCLKVENTYCYPITVQIFDINYFLTILPALQENDFDPSSLNLKCSVMQNPATINAICPGGKRGSGKRRCQEKMVSKYERAVRHVQDMIAVGDVNDAVAEALEPLLNLAIDIKSICKKKSRKKAKRIVKNICAPNPNEPTDAPDDDFPVCLKEKKITDECLRDEICDIDTEEPACNVINNDISTILATHENYQGLFKQKFLLPDDTVLSRKRARKICCSDDCWGAIRDGNWCPFEVYSAKLEILKEGVDLFKEISENPEKEKALSDSLCTGQQAGGADFLNGGCKCYFTRGKPASALSPDSYYGRRLLDTTHTVIANIVVNSTDPAPFSCERDGTLFGFDDALGNSSNSGVSLQVGMNVTEGKCKELEDDEESSPSDMGGGTGSSTSDAMQFSISFVAMFFCLFFAMNDSNM